VDGGMRKRLRESSAAERSRIKTGTLRDASAVAGYVKDDAGETYIVVAIVNHPLAKKQVARPILDALVDWVAAARARAGTPP
jgi:D-alanyl-D-alanine carboxypeptidase/D-alanyl-D-alanine-endopeptidase (penicillin-binding protein 4)